MNQRGVFEKVPESGVWWIRYADSTGRIRREKAGPKSSAIMLYRKRKTEVLQGKKLPERLRSKVVSFSDLAQDALSYSKMHKRSYRDDTFRMKKLVEWLGNQAAEGITPQDLEEFLAHGSEEWGWAPATVNRYRALLSLVYRLGILNKKVSTNPARLVRHRKENNSRVRWLSPEEESRLRKIIKRDYPDHMPEFELALHTGLRLGEMYGLSWEHVNLDLRLLTIPRSKNGESRHIRFNPVALSALRAFRMRGDGTGPVIRNNKEVPLLGPRHWFEPAVRDADLRDFTWHCLRHTFASRLVMKGVNLLRVQELLGHKTLAMTCRYAHLEPSHQLEAVERLCDQSEGLMEEPTDTKTSTTSNQEKIAMPA